MSTRSLRLITLTLLCVVSPVTLAQNKMLTVEDIFDPVKRVNFNGTTPTIRWLKDGKHYLVQKAGKQLVLMLYPKSRHGVTDPTLLTHMRQMMTDFIVGNL